MSFQVVLTESAIADVAQAVEFLLERSAPAAQQWLDGIEREIAGLEEMPFRAPLVPETGLARQDYRHLIHGAYRVIYRVDEERATVFVVRVYHASRKPLKPWDM